MVNKWVEHIKTFAKKNNLSYACALSNKECINSYKKSKEKPLEVPIQPKKAKNQIALEKNTPGLIFHQILVVKKNEKYI